MSSDKEWITKNFRMSEFTCHNGTEVPAKYVQNVHKLACYLQVLRDFYAKPIQVVSGYRTPAYNKRIGGAKNSQHMYAKAADIHMEGVPAVQLTATINGLIRLGLMKNGGIGVYPKRFHRRHDWVHYDIRDTPAYW